MWASDALVIHAGFRRHRFPYATTEARLTSQPLGARLFGTAAPGTVTGRFALEGSSVQALATTTRPEEALILSHGGQTYYVTPERSADFLDRFLPWPAV